MGIEGNVAQSCIYDDLSLKPSCLQFLPSNENYLLLGNQGGEIQLFDVRKPSDCVTKNTQMDKLITKIKFSPHDQKMFGVCSESTPLKIMQLDDKLSAIDLGMTILDTKILFEMLYGSRMQHQRGFSPV